MRVIILTISLLALVSGGKAAEPAKVAKLPVSIYCPAYAEGLESVWIKTGKHSFKSMALSTANVVGGLESRVEDGRIAIFGPAAGDGAHPVVATVVAGGIGQPLLVLTPEVKSGHPAYQCRIIESALSNIPNSSYHFVNFSPSAIRISYGESVIEIDSGAEKNLQLDGPAGVATQVTIAYKSGDVWRPMTSTRWTRRDDRRTLVCVQLDPRSKRMIIKSVPLR